MAKSLSPVEQYVIAFRDTQSLWSNLSAEQRKEAEAGIKWLQVVGEVYTGAKLRGRPPGSKNRAAKVTAEPEVLPGINAAKESGL